MRRQRFIVFRGGETREREKGRERTGRKDTQLETTYKLKAFLQKIFSLYKMSQNIRIKRLF